MRNIFLALVLANLAFAAWHLWFAESPRRARDEDPDSPSITLVRELPGEVADPSNSQGASANGNAAAVVPPSAPGDGAGARSPAGDSRARPAPATADEPLTLNAALAAAAAARAAAGVSAPAPAPAAADGSATRCSSVGPFRELAQAATAAASLRAAGYEPTQRVAEGDIWIGYWVYIEAITTEDEASVILERVRAQGIADSYVIPNSDSGNLVSLGVFSEISGVSKQRDKVRALGYDPKVVDRTRRATVYWVDVMLKGDQVLDFDALQTPGRIIRLEQRACEAPAA
jgi:cell division septation protein DedD